MSLHYHYIVITVKDKVIITDHEQPILSKALQFLIDDLESIVPPDGDRLNLSKDGNSELDRVLNKNVHPLDLLKPIKNDLK